MTTTPHTDRTRTDGRARLAVALLPVIGAALFAYWPLAMGGTPTHPPSGVSPTEDWFFSPVGSSAVPIYVLTAWLAARRSRRVVERLGDRTALLPGVLGVAVALALLVWAQYVSAHHLLAASLSLLLVSVGLVAAGPQGGRAMILPASFLAVLATPIPVPLLNRALYPLQEWTAGVVARFVSMLGLPAMYSGDLIFTHDGIFHVIETCSGVRASLTLVMSAVVYAEVFHRSRGRLLALCLVAPLIGVLVNLLRVLSLVVLPFSAEYAVHTVQGVAMLVLGVLLLAGVDALLSRLWPTTGSPERTSGLNRGAAGVGSGSVAGRVAVLSAALVVAGAVRFVVEPWTPPRTVVRSIHDVPRDLDPWQARAEPLAVDREFFGSTRFSQRTHRRYERGERAVELFVGLNDRQRPHLGLVSPKTEVLRPGWMIEERTTAQLSATGASVSELVLREPRGGRWLAFHWYEDVAGLGVETMRDLLALDRGPTRRVAPARVIRLATPLAKSPDARSQARATLIDFADRALPDVESVGRPEAKTQSH